MLLVAIGGVAMTQDTGSFKKVAVLTGLTMLVGGAEISTANADITQDVQFGPITTSTDLSFAKFDTTKGEQLTGVRWDLNSTINDGEFVDFSNASVSVNFLTIIGPQTSTGPFPGSFTVTPPLSFYEFAGSVNFPAGMIFNCVGENCGWSGDLRLTYTTVPVPLGPLPLWANLLAGLGLVGLFRRLKQKVTAQA